MSVVSLISLPATYAPNPNFVPPTSKMGWSNFQPISSQPDTAVQLQNPHLTLTSEQPVNAMQVAFIHRQPHYVSCSAACFAAAASTAELSATLSSPPNCPAVLWLIGAVFS